MDLIDSYEPNEEENDKENAEGNDYDDIAADADASGITTDPDTSTDTPRPLKFKFDTPEGVAAFVEWCLQSHPGNGSMAFHWKIWGDGADKKGFLQSNLILHALAYHLTCLDAIPGAYEQLDVYPESALLMAEQAVHHELKFWRTGEYVNPNKTANYFSADNCDDIVEIVQTPEGKKKKLTRRATKFLSTVQKWDDARWQEVIDGAKDFMELPGRKRAPTLSRSGSEAGDDPVLLDDDVMVLSD
ncbi:hypothetical protein B0H12DRAFT_1154408 [Mycena haematopus]|nr:hypothetical protein B0H12DRAFT_1164126 [Mycena haematopus]KAJ7215767.1 hypothetical protein B0H12DRAFT_1154408 [Mycena haematopus]